MAIDRRPDPNGASYSSSVAVQGERGRWVYVSGVIASGDRLADQTRGCFGQIGEALAGHGGVLADVVRITTYLTSLDGYGDFARIRGETFPGALPASTAVQVTGLLRGALIEIDAVAFIHDETAPVP